MALVDARGLAAGHEIQADVCVVGAGAAGLALAASFLGSGRRLALLESGGLEADAPTQSLYRGRSVGLPHAALDEGRLRYFGGTTNHWTAYVRPLEAGDFEERAWVPHSGWPIGRAALDPYYERARVFLRLPERAFDLEAWQGDERGRPWRFPGARVQSAVRQIVPERHRRLGRILRADLERAANVHVYLHANVVGIVPEASGEAVARLALATLGGARLGARARHYVLAAGGIENPRLLLLSALGRRGSPVGRYYANHPEALAAGTLLAAADPRFYARLDRDGVTTRNVLALAPRVQRQERLLGCSIDLRPRPRRAGAVGVAARLASQLRSALAPRPLELEVAGFSADFERLVARADGAAAPRRIGLHAVAEPAPNPDSRVLLGEEVDALGQRRVVLDWRVDEATSLSVRSTLQVLAREVGASGLGRVRVGFPEEGFAGVDPRGSHHHMGTTRMHSDPSRGVVDADCRVHGLANLFVAGSSVFPTYGTANPTFTLLGLAFRLADHLQGRSR